MGKHWNADSLAGKIREVLAKHPEGLFAHEIVEAVDAPRGPVHVALSTQLKAKRLHADMVDVPVDRRVHGGRALQYRYTNVSGAPQVAGSRFEALTATPLKPYTPPPVPPRRPVMTAPSLSKLQHDAALARGAADAPAVDVVADSVPADAAPVPTPITSAAALQRLERTLDLPQPAGAPVHVVPAPAAPLTAARPDPVVIDDPQQGPSAAVQARMAEQLEQILGPIPEAPSPSSERTADSTPSLRCALRSDGCLCIEFTESDEAFWLTRAETRILADYLLSFRVQPLEKLTSEGLACA